MCILLKLLRGGNMANLLDIREILDVNSFQKIQDDIAKATEFAMLQ